MKSRNVIRKKTGRPSIGKKPAAVFPMRLPDEMAKEIDDYAKREQLRSRSEAIRRLIEKALSGR